MYLPFVSEQLQKTKQKQAGPEEFIKYLTNNTYNIW